jgi:iron(III) transport system permease protein
MRRQLRDLLLILIAAPLVLPMLVVLGSWLQADAASLQILREMAATVLPQYVSTSLVLCVVVGACVALVGTACAVAVAFFDFPGRRHFEWALLLPLAMPAYVIAYAYTDFLQFSGALQNWLRASFGLQGQVLPEIRSVGGAAWVFVCTLYPYVYLMARTALVERSARLLDAARTLGSSLPSRILRVALPLARPAIAAGVALALMETLADFGASSYFGIQTFSVGIYKAWIAMDNRVAASQLATMLLMLVAILLALERWTRRGQRFADTRTATLAPPHRAALHGPAAAAAWLICALPILAGFVLPVAVMLQPLADDFASLPWGRFLQWSFNSLKLGAISAVLAVAIALVLAASVRRTPGVFTRGAVQLAMLGYAAPGTVIVVGLLMPVGWLQHAAPGWPASYWVTGTILGVVWAYLVRFVSVALQSVQSGFSRIPASMDDSARMLGARGWRVLRAVHGPLLRRPIAAAALLVFVDVMKELPATLVLRPFNSDTLAVVAYQLARDERLSEAALPSLALVLVGLLPVVLLSRALRMGSAGSSEGLRLLPGAPADPCTAYHRLSD